MAVNERVYADGCEPDIWEKVVYHNYAYLARIRNKVSKFTGEYREISNKIAIIRKYG